MFSLLSRLFMFLSFSGTLVIRPWTCGSTVEKDRYIVVCLAGCSCCFAFSHFPALQSVKARGGFLYGHIAIAVEVFSAICLWSYSYKGENCLSYVARAIGEVFSASYLCSYGTYAAMAIGCRLLLQ